MEVPLTFPVASASPQVEEQKNETRTQKVENLSSFEDGVEKTNHIAVHTLFQPQSESSTVIKDDHKVIQISQSSSPGSQIHAYVTKNLKNPKEEDVNPDELNLSPTAIPLSPEISVQDMSQTTEEGTHATTMTQPPIIGGTDTSQISTTTNTDAPVTPQLQPAPVNPQATVTQVQQTPQQQIDALFDPNSSSYSDFQKLSTQNKLSKIVEICRSNPSAKVNIKAELAKTNGEYDLEPFTPKGAPDKTFYKTKATYTIEVDGVTLNIPAIQGEIFTSATDPNIALMAALNYTKVVTDLALTPDGQTGNLEGVPRGDKRKKILEQRSFEFNVAFDGIGKPTGIASIKAGEKGDIELKFKKKAEETSSGNYRYVYDTATRKLRPLGNEEPILDDGKHLYFETEEQAILNINHKIKNDHLYDSLEKSSNFEERLMDIQKDIEKKAKDSAQLREEFKKEGQIKAEFKQFAANLHPGAKNKNDLSPTMRAYLSKKEELRSHPLAQIDHDAEIKMLKDRKTEVQGSDTTSPASTPQPSSPTLKDLIDKLKQRHPTDTDLAAIDSSNPDAAIDKLILAKEKEKTTIETIKKELTEYQQAVAEEQAKFTRNFNRLQDVNRGLTRRVEQLEEALIQAKQKRGIHTADHERANAFIKAFDPQIDILKEQIKENDRLIKDLKSLLPIEMRGGAILNPVSIDVADSVEELSPRAEKLLKDKNWEAAAKEFKEILKLNPYDSFALAGYAEALRNMQGRTEEAAKYFERSLKYNVKNVLALTGYAKILQGRENFEKAAQYFQAALQLDPKNPSVLTGYANMLADYGKRLVNEALAEQNAAIKKAKLNDAENKFKQALALNPEISVRDYSYLLVIYGDLLTKEAMSESDAVAKRNKLKNAEKKFEQLLALEGKKPISFTLSRYAETLRLQAKDEGGVMQKRELLEAAEEHFRRALKLEKRNKQGSVDPFIIKNYALTLSMLGKFDVAEKAYKQVVELERRNDELSSVSLNGYGTALFKNGKFAEAEKIYYEAIEVERRTSGTPTQSSLNGYAEALYQTGQLIAAQAYKELAAKIQQSPNALKEFEQNLENMNDEAERLLSQNKYAEAVEQFKKVLNIDPRNSRALSGAAHAYIKLEQLEEAEPLLGRLIELKPNSDIIAYRKYHDILLKLNKNEEAKELFDKAAKLFPTSSFFNPELKINLKGRK
jgi:tetratricopeptide (TPR) repeat protein